MLARAVYWVARGKPEKAMEIACLIEDAAGETDEQEAERLISDAEEY